MSAEVQLYNPYRTSIDPTLRRILSVSSVGSVQFVRFGSRVVFMLQGSFSLEKTRVSRNDGFDTNESSANSGYRFLRIYLQKKGS